MAGLPGCDADVLELLLVGVPQTEIARRLHLSTHTVSHAAQRLARSVRASNTNQLIAFVYMHRLEAKDAIIAEQAGKLARLEEAMSLIGRRREDRDLRPNAPTDIRDARTTPGIGRPARA